jgi:hypothetical protein
MRPHFRFEDLEIWQLARQLAVKFHQVADQLDRRKFFRYAEQLRGTGLSLTNNSSPSRRQTSNIQHPTSNIQHPTSNIEHPTSNIEHPTSNIEHPTSNVQHRTSNIERQRRFAVVGQCFQPVGKKGNHLGKISHCCARPAGQAKMGGTSNISPSRRLLRAGGQHRTSNIERQRRFAAGGKR